MSKSWGTPTWYFFHSFAEHIDDDFYKVNKYIICDLLRSICSNLPCYDCTLHATQYTKHTLLGQYIPDKESLKQYFFAFHNSVNIKTGKEKFTDYNMYKKSKLQHIVKLFINKFCGYRNPHRAFADSLNRRIICDKITNLLRDNSSYFTWL